MPLRSVEAATRDDAIAAAREQFGPQARVVGVRRVRSGGVLGFFATERYIAEVAPDQFVRRGVPASASEAAPTASSYGSPLASASPARAAAPARNGAAAWAAEAARSGSAAPGVTGRSPSAWDVPARTAPARPAAPALDDDRLDELAGLLGAAPAASPPVPAEVDRDPFPRAVFPKTSREPVRAASRIDQAAPAATPPAGLTPSPFTAALARMVSGDREVRQAVAEALEEPVGRTDAVPTAPAPETSPAEPAPRLSLAAAIRAAESSLRSQGVHREEAPGRDQVTAPPSMATTSSSGLPTWADTREVAAPAPSARQEEVAEALRAALAQGHSDEALAGILRKLLAGESPQEALSAPPVAETPASAVAEEPAGCLVEESVATDPTVALPEDVAGAASEVAAEAPAEVSEMVLLARTASDPAPMSVSLDATTVMPRISLLPSLAGSRGRSLPPVPPSPSGPSSRTSAPVPREGTATRTLATVTRLPVAPLRAGEKFPDLADTPATEPGSTVTAAPAPGAVVAAAAPGDVVAGLVELGLPRELLGDDAAARIAAEGTYAALTGALAARLPEAPELPSGAGDVLFIVGPGVEPLRAARALAASLRLDAERVQWATRGDLAGLAPKSSRTTTVDAAIDRRQEAAGAATVTIVAVDAPLRSDVYWMAQMLAIWSPVAVWAVVEATRKPEDVELWLDGLPRVDALVVQDTDLSADPAAVLQRLNVPVALLDGVRATPHRWASLLCERLDDPQT